MAQAQFRFAVDDGSEAGAEGFTDSSLVGTGPNQLPPEAFEGAFVYNNSVVYLNEGQSRISLGPAIWNAAHGLKVPLGARTVRPLDGNICNLLLDNMIYTSVYTYNRWRVGILERAWHECP